MATASIPERRAIRGPKPRPLAAPRQTASRGLLALLPAIVMLYSILLPQEVRVTLAGQTIYPYRGAALLVLPWLVYVIANGRFAFRPVDFLVLAGCGWMVVSYVVLYGIGRGLPSGGALAMDVLVPYLVARYCIRTPNDLRRLLVLFAPGAFLAGLTMMAEAITHRPIIHDLASRVFGPLSALEYGREIGSTTFVDYRLGLMRASGPFSHPIHAGVIMATLVPLYYSSGLKGWPLWLGLAAGAMSVFAVSSGAFLALLIGVSLLAYDWLQRHLPVLSWSLFIVGATTVLAVVQAFSQNGVIPILIRYTLNPATGYYRQLIWEYASASVLRHPLFGIGFKAYERLPWMTESIDHYWLALAVRYGLPTSICLLVVGLAAVIVPALAARRASAIDRRLFVGVAVACFGIFMIAFTVSYFGGSLTFVFILIGSALSIGSTEIVTAKQHRFFRPKNRFLAGE